jgi:hypothetical protein
MRWPPLAPKKESGCRRLSRNEVSPPAFGCGLARAVQAQADQQRHQPRRRAASSGLSSRLARKPGSSASMGGKGRAPRPPAWATVPTPPRWARARRGPRHRRRRCGRRHRCRSGCGCGAGAGAGAGVGAGAGAAAGGLAGAAGGVGAGAGPMRLAAGASVPRRCATVRPRGWRCPCARRPRDLGFGRRPSRRLATASACRGWWRRPACGRPPGPARCPWPAAPGLRRPGW